MDMPVQEVLYNVIKRPLSDGKRQKKGESRQDFVARVAGIDPKLQFFRWEYAVGPNDLKAFRQRVLDPLLTSIANWWDAFNGNPFDPWTNPIHFIRPYGVYDPLAEGLAGPYYGYISSGSTSGLKPISTVFPELNVGKSNGIKDTPGDTGRRTVSKADVRRVAEAAAAKREAGKQPVRCTRGRCKK
jgi:hypothetical protein